MIRRLVLIRHGKSLYDEYVSNDIERHLAGRGYHDVAETAQWLLQKNIVPDLIVTSPAIRAYSTCLLVANALAYPSENIVLKSAIYEASDAALLYVINELSDDASTVFLFGHNPSFTSIVSKLTNSEFRHMPTSGVVVVDFENRLWSEVEYGSGTLKDLFCSHKAID